MQIFTAIHPIHGDGASSEIRRWALTQAVQDCLTALTVRISSDGLLNEMLNGMKFEMELSVKWNEQGRPPPLIQTWWIGRLVFSINGR